MANSDVKINVGVSGVAQFKQGMKESQAAVKNLEQQLKLNEAQLKKNGDEERYLQNKTELLTKQIEEQKNVVSKANQALQQMDRDGVSKTSVAFQNMQQQVYKASTQLTEMQAELAGVGDSGQEAADNVSEMNYQLNNISRNVSFENVVNGISKVTDGLEAAARKAVELGKKLVQAMLSGGQWADDLQTTADKWEMSPEQVYRMRQTANLIDTDAETIFQARKKLTAAMGKGSDKETMGAFAALGISNLAGSDENIERVFWKAGEGLMQMEDKVARNEYATKLYGRSWEELIPIFKTGREAYEEMMGSWTWIGDDQFENLTKLNDEEQKLTTEWENFQHQFEAALAPAMTQVMETLEGLLKQFNEYLASPEGQEMLASLGEAVSSLFADLATIDPEQVVSGIVDLFNKIKEGLEWVIKHRAEVYDALKYIAGGFALLKLTELASNIGRIVSGLGGLFGGGKGSGNQMDVTQAGRPGGSYGTQSGGALVGASNWVTGALSKAAAAITMYDPTGLTAMLPMAIGDMTTLGRTIRDGGTVGEAVGNSWETIKASAEEGIKNFTDYFSKDLQSGMWGIVGVKDAEDLDWKIRSGAENAQRALFGSGDQFQYVPTEEDLARAALRIAESERRENTEPMDRMTQVAGEMTGEVAATRAVNEGMTAAVEDLSSLPADLQTAITNAVITGMSSVSIIINEGAVSAIGERVSYGWGGKVQAMTK